MTVQDPRESSSSSVSSSGGGLVVKTSESQFRFRPVSEFFVEIKKPKPKYKSAVGYNNYTTWCSPSFVSVFVSTIRNDLR